MTFQQISLLLADVDGTLVTREKVLTERAQAAIRGLSERGIQFAITSGRPPRGMAMLFDKLALRTPISGFNGGMIVQQDMSIIEAHTLPQDVAQTAVELLIGHGVDVWVYAGNEWYVRDAKAPHVDRESWTVKFAPQVIKTFDAVLQGAVKIVGVTDDHALMETCERDAQRSFGNRTTTACSQPYYLDITHPEANKGAVVKYLSKTLGIPESEIATIGDQPNDVLMFQRSGFSIAMGNASDEVKAKATVTTTDSENEGFARAVEAHLLGGAT